VPDGFGFTVEYRGGWHAEERDARGTFRWTSREASCRLGATGANGPGLLRISSGLWRAHSRAPRIEVSVNGRPAGGAIVSLDLAHRVFPVDICATLDIDLALDGTFTVPGDPRDLGMMVRDIQLFSADGVAGCIDAEGWYEWERHEYFPFRWMGKDARVVLPLTLLGPARFVEVPIYAPGRTGEQTLTAAAGSVARIPLRHGWHIYAFEVPDVLRARAGERAFADLAFALDRMAGGSWHEGDPRELGVAVGDITFHDDRRRHDFVARFHAETALMGAAAAGGDPVAGTTASTPDDLPIDGDGWHVLEHGETGAFRWMKQEARLRLPRASDGGGANARLGRFCVIPVFSAYRNLAQELDVLANGRAIARWPLMKGWNEYHLALGSNPGDDLLTLRLNKLIPAASHQDDARDLGVRVGILEIHHDEDRYAQGAFIQRNRTQSQRELLSGSTVLSSRPSSLGIDLYGKCNIKPACVYCPWDRMKALEGDHVDVAIDDRTLESYGDLFAAAESLVNCSFGEPLLHPRISQVLELVERQRKTLELSTNGQAFSARTVGALTGKPVFLYVSLDSASPGTYAKLRNDRWHEIVAGLLFLREARRHAGGWPRLNMVFMPMRCNLGDLEDCFKLARLVDADALVLRPLLLEESHVDTERAGYRFVYEQEHLDRDDLDRLVVDCRRLAHRYGVSVRTQFDFGKIDFGTIEAPRIVADGRSDGLDESR
jgi:MoaA/NifB/PqqE/SkfB family radical SAM enzyme